MSKTLYYQNAPLTEEDFSDLSESFKLPYDLVAEVVGQIRECGEPQWVSYTGTVRERVRKLSEAITEELETITKEQEETTEKEKTETAEPIVEPLSKSENDDIVEHAAISLMQAMSETESGSFLITDDGVCTINPKSPPSLAQSYEVVHKVIKLRELAPKMENKTSWMLGSIVFSLEELYANHFEISQVSEQSEKSYNTIWTAVRVFEAFRNKRYNLSFTHHKEAFFQKIPEETKHLILHKAETFSLSAMQVRHLSVIAKKMNDDTVIKNIRSTKQADDLIKAYKESKVLFIVYNDGKWTRTSRLAGEVPQGAVIIDTKNWTARANNENPIKIEKE